MIHRQVFIDRNSSTVIFIELNDKGLKVIIRDGEVKVLEEKSLGDIKRIIDSLINKKNIYKGGTITIRKDYPKEGMDKLEKLLSERKIVL